MIDKKYYKDWVYQLSKITLGRVRRFKDIHRGDSCYLFGDGVSVKSMDLSLFSDKISFASNYLPFHNDFNNLNCLYCVWPAPYAFCSYLGFDYDIEVRDHLKIMSPYYKDLMRGNDNISYFFNLSNYPFIRGDNIYHLFRNIPDKSLPENFISNRIECFDGVFRSSIMLAIYMGFDNIYLVGFDNTHTLSRYRHWYEKGEGIKNITSKVYQKEFFEIAKEYTDITTITLDGNADLLNSITYKEHTGHDPIYNENTDLLKEKYLKALKVFPGYVI